MNDRTPLVSVIIPVFNKHRHLKKCLRSLRSQTYPAIETIVVDDCSSDPSPAKIRHMPLRLPEAKIIRTGGNPGPQEARYAGIAHAHGEFVTFIDADDWLEQRAIQVMVETMVGYKADLVQIRNRRRMKGMALKYQERYDEALADRLIEGEEFRSLASYVGLDSYIFPECWGKLYRTDKLRETTRIDINQAWGEDQIFNIQYLRECKSMVFRDFIGYNCRWDGQTSSNYKYKALREYKNVHQLKRMLGQNQEQTDYEIVWLLRYHVRSLITELGYTREAVEMILTDELRDPLWTRVGVTESAAEIVDAEYSDIQRNPIKYLAKRLMK